jgi:uncharacterized glyoxalase superfamily protein PhnB
MQNNRSIPDSAIIPELPYENVSLAADWLCKAFGFQIRLVIRDHRVQLTYGQGAIVVVQGEAGALPRCQTLVRVLDVDAHSQQALRHGAKLVMAPTDFPYGERQYLAADFAGHAWKFSQTLADVDPRDWGGELRL